MPAFDPSVYWPALWAAGLLCVATDTDGDFKVGYARPSEFRLDGQSRTNEHEIEYQFADRPDLAQGDTLSIADASGNNLGNFRVRMAPYVSAPGNAADGYFYCAVLTKV